VHTTGTRSWGIKLFSTTCRASSKGTTISWFSCGKETVSLRIFPSVFGIVQGISIPKPARPITSRVSCTRQLTTSVLYELADLDHHQPSILEYTPTLDAFLLDHGVQSLDHTSIARLHDSLIKAVFGNNLVSPMLHSSLGRDELKSENVDGDVSKHLGRLEKDGAFGRDGASDRGVGSDVYGVRGGGKLSTGKHVGLVVRVFYHRSMIRRLNSKSDEGWTHLPRDHRESDQQLG
jgi:hypothetical protein